MEDSELDLLASNLFTSFSNGRLMGSVPSEAGMGMTEAYKLGSRLVALKRQGGHLAVGRKVGFANKALWRLLKLDTLAWGYMWDDTVHDLNAASGQASLSAMYSPRLEPEVVFKIKEAVGPDLKGPAAALRSVEWMALGFEINDCIFPDWKFKPADFVATLGFHKSLVIGQHVAVAGTDLEVLADQLAAFKLSLFKDDQLIAEGSGRNCLRSPALCLIELARILSDQGTPLAAGELISTGTLTDPLPIAPGERWTARVDGIALPTLEVSFA